MDCNKDEAERARDIAVQKMQNKEFSGARKMALRAQQIFPDVEHINQLLTVCDVHCAAENKLHGNEMDWYGILQIEQDADDTTIKKQYRKLALSLHPDKNKFSGAESAFMLIGEAQRLLLDRGKRVIHDTRRNVFGKPSKPPCAPQPANNNPPVGKQSGIGNNLRNCNATSQHAASTQNQQPQPHAPNDKAFWLSCPFCGFMYRFFPDTLNKTLPCRSCSKPFIIQCMKAQNVQPEINASHRAFQNQNEVPNQQDSCRVDQQSTSSDATFGVKSRSTSCDENPKRNSNLQTPFGPDVNAKVGKNRCSKRVNVKRRRKVEDSSESCFVSEVDGNLEATKGVGFQGEQFQKRYRPKQKVSCNDNSSFTDENLSPFKMCKGCGYTEKDKSEININAGLAADVKFGQEEVHLKGALSGVCPKDGEKRTEEVQKNPTNTEESSVRSLSSSCPRGETCEYSGKQPAPEFGDFGKDRTEECVNVGQVWAVYDTIDKMPRSYVLITAVSRDKFKLQITWLKPDPEDEDKIRWVKDDLPVSCGKFISGQSENIACCSRFSHVVREKVSPTVALRIYPRKGQTWALFKHWDIDWQSLVAMKRNCEFEYVEIVTDYFENVGICVVFLEKVKGFSSLYAPVVKEGKIAFELPPSQLLRFSHMIPSFQMTGEEKGGVPRGSFELDPASLPSNIKAGVLPNESIPEVGVPNLEADVSPRELKPESVAGHSNGCGRSRSANFNPEKIDVPEPEFYDFDAVRCVENFQVGQLWALYSDEDAMPKYYGRIKKIRSRRDSMLEVTWLENFSSAEEMVHWHDKDMLRCCGKFKLNKVKGDTCSAEAFSHLLKPEVAGKKNEWTIFPKKGEVWAMYKNWNVNMKHQNIEEFEYDIVEVLEENASHLEVLVLQRVAGFNSVFQCQKKGSSLLKLRIPRVELLRLSHQIPAFRLTKERDGSLRGFWELDPAAVPVPFFCSA